MSGKNNVVYIFLKKLDFYYKRGESNQINRNHIYSLKLTRTERSFTAVRTSKIATTLTTRVHKILADPVHYLTLDLMLQKSYGKMNRTIPPRELLHCILFTFFFLEISTRGKEFRSAQIILHFGTNLRPW